DISQWHIVHRDQYPTPPKKESTCTNCGERGHVKFKCRNAPKLAICYMCGDKGHREPRCPKTICFNCGAKTRSFVRGCKSCSREADVTCFLCGVRGHTQRSCPDLWRRYHSTTEDNVPLKEDFERNSKARWCSICGRPGHQAHACNDARRIFGHPIPSVSVSSYMPTYRGEFNRYSKLQNDEQDRRLAENPTARYNLFSDNANVCEFNLNEQAQNEKGFYFNFLKSTGLLEKHLQFNREQEQAGMQQEPLAAPSPIQTAPPDPHPAVELEIKQEETQPEQQTMEQTASVTEPCQQQPTSSSVLVEENSNYSFSEFNNDTFTDMLNFSNNVQEHVE
uniref:Zinc finger CCHC domain-containing protein 7 n=1 Tax=Anopheles maculatus TaxID=74869 RepID=A0A182S5F3_9DIPT